MARFSSGIGAPVKRSVIAIVLPWMRMKARVRPLTLPIDATTRIQHRGTAPAASTGVPVRPAVLVVCAALASLAMMAPSFRSVLQGGFSDPDDAMRLVEVRAWLAGQSWTDVSAWRLDPPNGASMHWSRLVDLPPAAFIVAFRTLFAQASAEALARIAVPALLLVGLCAGMARLALVLFDRAGLALVGLFLSAVVLAQVQPGRIGHHAPETVALLWAVGAAAASFDPRRARQAGVAGVLVALALAMSLETLPFQGLLCAAMLFAWVARGAPLAPTLRWFGLGLGAALPVLFIATVAPARWAAPVRDAFGAPHLVGGTIVATGALVLASCRVPRLAHRLGAVAALGVACLATLVLIFPDCLRGPFADVDPLVREIWLDNVVESRPLAWFLRNEPMLGLVLGLPVVLGLGGLLVAAWTARGTAALRFRLVAAMVAFGLALGFVQVRVLASVMPLALCGGVYAAGALRARLADGRAAGLAAIAPALIVPFTATAWALVLPADAPTRDARGDLCLAPAALAPLAGLPPGRAVVPIDAGSSLLAGTRLDVFDAPYHRDNDGNRFAYDVMSAAPDAARALLAARGTDYVVTCAGLNDTERLAVRAPDGLAAHILAGDIPVWLRPMPLAGTPYRVFAVDGHSR